MPVARCSNWGMIPLCVGRVQVLNDHKGHAAARRHLPQEMLQGLEPPCGGPNADNRE